jgi:hypothetical protein
VVRALAVVQPVARVPVVAVVAGLEEWVLVVAEPVA